MDKIGRLYYWTRNKGPKKGAIIYQYSIVEIDFENHSAVEIISKADAKLAVATAVKTKIWTAEYIGPHNSTQWVAGTTLEDVAEKVRIQKENDFATEEAITSDTEKYLERELQNHDWNYAYSDDHNVWLSGESHKNLINRLMQLIPEEKARKLWEKYSK